MTNDLFDETDKLATIESIQTDAVVLRNEVQERSQLFADLLRDVIRQEPLRKMYTRGGKLMSITSTSCGDYGWKSEQYSDLQQTTFTYKNYTPYSRTSPKTNKAWPPIPKELKYFAIQCSEKAGFGNFEPDSCLINCYRVGTKLGIHQDLDERDKDAPIVSVSLGLPAIFLWGGLTRNEKIKRLRLKHGDVVVWGKSARQNFHGVAEIKPGFHPVFKNNRINLTFRKTH